MRLGNTIVSKINKALKNSFGEVDIYLFGSRTDDTKKGGDIDLAINTKVASDEFKALKNKFLTELFKQDFDYKIDVVNYNTKNELLKSQIDKNAILLK